MEYLYTNLPRYITVTPRSAFANSVVQSGSVLLFSEDGTSLTAKLPDGSFVTVGGSGGTDVSDTTAEAGNVQSGYYFYNSAGVRTEGTLTVSGGIDVSDTTATAAMVLSGAVFHDSTGAVTTGTIPTVSASVTSGAVVVPAGYIPTSQSFPVSSGVDFSSVTAIPSTVLGGEVFIDSSGQFQEGTMPINMGETITPSTSSQTVSSGQYLAGAVVVEGDAALVGSNIVSGVSIFGVTGTASGGATNFYKCAWVNTANNHTWHGYKAVFDSVTGIYGYEVTATTGLTCSLVTPVVGRVYADGALIEAKLWEGILLPDSPIAYGYPDPTWTSGQKLSSWGTFTQSDSTKQFEIATINGVTGLQNAAGMSMTAPSAITGNFSFCVKAYIAPNAALSGSCPILDTNSWGGALFALWANADSGTYPMLSMRGYSFAAYSAPDMSALSGVHTLVMTYNTDGTTKLYLDGVLSSSEYYDPGFDHGQTLYLLADTADVLTLGVAAYNRELTAAEAASIIW